LITPANDGWRISGGSAEARAVKTLQEAATATAGNGDLQLALPCNAALMERLTLPSTDADELHGMVRLQLEKTLPFPLEEVTTGYEVISQAGNESTLLAIAVNNKQLDALCEPLRQQSRLPGRITVFAMHAAMTCPPDKVVLLVYREEGKIVLAICENARLGYAQTFDASDADALVNELPQMLLSAELAGASTNFAEVRLERSCARLLGALVKFFDLPVSLVALDEVASQPQCNLLPASWRSETKRVESAAKLKSWLVLSGLMYFAVVGCALAYLLLLRIQVNRLDRKIAADQPQIEFVKAREARWKALAPGIDPARYPVEVLFQIYKSLPDEGVRITQFDQSLTQFMVEGEAPTANLAIQFGEQLKKNPELGSYKFEMGPPTILPNDHAQFRFFGKL
jgi:hypothetical protein